MGKIILDFSNYAKNYASTVYKSLCGPCHWFRELEQSADFSLLIYLDAIKFVLLSFFTLVKKIQLKILAKPLTRNVKSPLPVHFCRSKTPLVKFPTDWLMFSGPLLDPPLIVIEMI